MKIIEVQAVSITGGWYCDDKASFASGNVKVDHYLAQGVPETPGFKAVREVSKGISIILYLENGQAVCGDGTSVTYAGASGRDPVFRFEEHINIVEKFIAPWLRGQDIANLLELVQDLETLSYRGRRLHTALRYAVSQAVLEGAALAMSCTKAEVLAEAFGLKISKSPIRIGIQSGEDRYAAVDKAIYHRVDVFPHGLIKNVERDLGQNGDKLMDYARWIMSRLTVHNIEAGYRPSIHFDCYGTIGKAFDYNVNRMANYLIRLKKIVEPLELQIESPVEMDTLTAQIDILTNLREALASQGDGVTLIADEWCNTLDDIVRFAQAGAVDMIQIKMPDLGAITQSVKAVLECRRHGIRAYVGGSCNETDLNARNALHVAVATGAEQLLARPGMGVDEAVCIVRNEEARLRAIIEWKGL